MKGWVARGYPPKLTELTELTALPGPLCFSSQLVDVREEVLRTALVPNDRGGRHHELCTTHKVARDHISAEWTRSFEAQKSITEMLTYLAPSSTLNTRHSQTPP